MARHFRMGIDEIIRQAELDEMQKKWAAENARIMAEHPMPPPEEADDAAHAYPNDVHVMTPLPQPTHEPPAHEPAPAHDEAMAPTPVKAETPKPSDDAPKP